MKLTCDEYWLNFHVRRKDELVDGTRKIMDLLTRLQSQIGTDQGDKFIQFTGFFGKAKPVDSVEILANLKSLKSALIETITQAKLENDKLNYAIRKIIPIASRIINFESIDQGVKLQNLLDEVESEKSSVDGVSKSIESILPSLQSHEESRKRDIDRLLIMSQYPFAKRWIRSRLNERKKLEAAKMPFQRDVSVMYIRMYAASTPSVTYDDELEEIRVA